MAKLLELSDQEIIDIANPLWEDLIRTSNNKDYGGFTKNFSKKMIEINKQKHKQTKNNKQVATNRIVFF